MIGEAIFNRGDDYILNNHSNIWKNLIRQPVVIIVEVVSHKKSLIANTEEAGAMYSETSKSTQVTWGKDFVNLILLI